MAELKKGDRVWVLVPTNATVKSVNQKYGYAVLTDEGVEYQYFRDGEVRLLKTPPKKVKKEVSKSKR